MNLLESMNRIIVYLESHLEEELNLEEAASMAGYSLYHFQRLFMTIAGISLTEYIRMRRLSRAAFELQNSDIKVLDLALKYGYSSPTSFNRAFAAMHGVGPREARKPGTQVKAFPPLSFELTVKGASIMNYRVETLDSFQVIGAKLSTTMKNMESYRAIPSFWETVKKSGTVEQILSLLNQKPFGLLGVSAYDPDFSSFDYYIACSSDMAAPEGMDQLTVPASSWAVFSCQSNDAGSIQDLQRKVIMDWLPESGYEFANGPDIELYTAEGDCEIWLPVKKP